MGLFDREAEVAEAGTRRGGALFGPLLCRFALLYSILWLPPLSLLQQSRYYYYYCAKLNGQALDCTKFRLLLPLSSAFLRFSS